MFAAMVPILFVALILEPVPDMTSLSWETIIALVYLFTLPMVFCQWAYFKVVTIFPAAIAASKPGRTKIPAFTVAAASAETAKSTRAGTTSARLSTAAAAVPATKPS